MLEDVLEFVKNNGVTSGKDLAHLGKAHSKFASWKSTRASSSALEYLWIMGKLAVVERTSLFQKNYDLIENYIPKKFLKKETNTQDALMLKKFLVLQQSFPVIIVGKMKIKDGQVTFGKNYHFIPKMTINLENIEIAKIADTKKTVLIPKNYETMLSKEPFDEHMRLIGVLDPLIWDRVLLKNIFNFDYTWEVYKKEKDRIWGYYVFPLLYQGKFIGRMEAKQLKEKNLKILKIFNVQVEKDVKISSDLKFAYKDLLERFKYMTSSNKLVLDKSDKL